MSWEARLLANMDRKQTKDSFNHASGQRIFLGAGTRYDIQGANSGPIGNTWRLSTTDWAGSQSRNWFKTLSTVKG